MERLDVCPTGGPRTVTPPIPILRTEWICRHLFIKFIEKEYARNTGQSKGRRGRDARTAGAWEAAIFEVENVLTFLLLCVCIVIQGRWRDALFKACTGSASNWEWCVRYMCVCVYGINFEYKTALYTPGNFKLGKIFLYIKRKQKGNRVIKQLKKTTTKKN